jgi:DNA-binding transcriptional LysR family regulator
MVAPGRSALTSARLQAAFSEAAVRMNIVAEAEFFASVCGLVASGAGWSIVDPLSARTFAHLGLVVRPFEPAITYEIGAFHRRDREPSVLAATFLELIAAKLSI